MRRLTARTCSMLGVLAVAAGLASCSVIGLESHEPLACEGDPTPTTAPGEAGVLLTVAEGTSRWDLVTVVYTDGVVVRAPAGSRVSDLQEPAESASPSPSETEGAASPWTTGYLLPCAVAELRDRAEGVFFGGPEFGRVGVPDEEWTFFRYDNGISSASVQVHAFDRGFTDGLEWSERRARDDLREVTDLLRANLVITGEEVPVAAVQLDGEMPDGAVLPSTWPGPPAAELLGDEGCGVLPEDVTTDVFRYGLEHGLGDAGADLNLRALPPGVAGCA